MDAIHADGPDGSLFYCSAASPIPGTALYGYCPHDIDGNGVPNLVSTRPIINRNTPYKP